MAPPHLCQSNPLSSRELECLKSIIAGLCKRNLLPQDSSLVKASMTRPYTQHLTIHEYNRLRSIIQTGKKHDFPASDLKLLRSIMRTSSMKYRPEWNNVQSTMVAPNTPSSAPGSDRLSGLMETIRANHLSAPELNRLRSIMAATNKNHRSGSELNILNRVMESNGTQHLSVAQFNHLKAIIAAPDTQKQSASNHFLSVMEASQSSPSTLELDSLKSGCSNEKSQGKRSKSYSIISPTISKVNKRKTQAKRPTSDAKSYQLSSDLHYDSSSSDMSKESPVSDAKEEDERYTQLSTIEPHGLRKLIHLKSIIMGPRTADGTRSILDRLNNIIKTKKVSRALISELLDDWNCALRALSDVDAQLFLYDFLAKQS